MKGKFVCIGCIADSNVANKSHVLFVPGSKAWCGRLFFFLFFHDATSGKPFRPDTRLCTHGITSKCHVFPSVSSYQLKNNSNRKLRLCKVALEKRPSQVNYCPLLAPERDIICFISVHFSSGRRLTKMLPRCGKRPFEVHEQSKASME